MKKIMLVTLMGMFLLVETLYATEMRPVASSPTTVWIKLSLIFHRPKLQCQEGFGVCAALTWGIDAPTGTTTRETCTVRAQLNSKNQLIIEITEADITSYNNGATLPYFRNKSSISIPDPYTLPRRHAGRWEPRRSSPSNPEITR